MSGGNISQDGECGVIQELLVWMPTGSLTSLENQKVEAHVAKCEACAELLGFASEFKSILVEEFPAHPDAAALVDFVENRAAMDSSVRKGIEKHLEICRECQDEIEMLETVERTASVEDGVESRSRQVSHRSVREDVYGRRWWEIFLGAALRPAAAAVYLVIAVVAVGLLMTRPDRGDFDGDSRGVLGGVTIVSDEMGAMRGGESTFEAASFEADEAQFLLLELTGLGAPPVPNDMYTVRLVQAGTDLVWERSVTGRVFSENYSLCLFLAPGSLEPGQYDVDVVDVSGGGVFHSTLLVK